MKNTQSTGNEIKETLTHALKGTASAHPSRELTQKLLAMPYTCRTQGGNGSS
jgi:hypothetical protein